MHTLSAGVIDAVRLVVVARQHRGTNQRLPDPVLELTRLMLAQLRVNFSPEIRVKRQETNDTSAESVHECICYEPGI